MVDPIIPTPHPNEILRLRMMKPDVTAKPAIGTFELLLLLIVCTTPVVRVARAHDLHSICNLAAVIEPTHRLKWWPQNVGSSVGFPRWLVMQRAGILIGCVACTAREASYGLPERGHLSVLAVDQRWRRRGYGAVLVRAALRELESYSCVSLFVRVGNEPAIRLYHRNGFRRHQRIAGYYGAEDALLCVRWRVDVGKTGLRGGQISGPAQYAIRSARHDTALARWYCRSPKGTREQAHAKSLVRS
jgi:ribosomal protein S18 acetylase RimI-like enzyme